MAEIHFPRRGGTKLLGGKPPQAASAADSGCSVLRRVEKRGETDLLLDVIFICSLLLQPRDLLLLLAELFFVHLRLFCQPADGNNREREREGEGGCSWKEVRGCCSIKRETRTCGLADTRGRNHEKRKGEKTGGWGGGSRRQGLPVMVTSLRVGHLSSFGPDESPTEGDAVRSSPAGWKDTHLENTRPTHRSGTPLPPLASESTAALNRTQQCRFLRLDDSVASVYTLNK